MTRLLLRLSLLPLVVLALAACDKSYEAHLSVTVPSNATQSAESVATDLLSHLRSRFDLRCDSPETWKTPPSSSPEASEVHRACSVRNDYTQIEIVTAGNHLTVEIDKISGANEPETFRALRLATQEHLERAVPGARVSVEFPDR